MDPQLDRIFHVTATKPFLLKLPNYQALPAPIFKWEFKSKNNNFFDVIDPSLFVTARGDLLFSSVEGKLVGSYRVFINHQSLPLDIVQLYILRGKCKYHIVAACSPLLVCLLSCTTCFLACLLIAFCIFAVSACSLCFSTLPAPALLAPLITCFVKLLAYSFVRLLVCLLAYLIQLLCIF